MKRERERERGIYIKGIHHHEAVLHVFLYFMEFMFHAFTLLLALDHIEASVFIPLGVHPSFFQHHRLVLVEKNMNTILYILSFTSHSPTYRRHTTSDMKKTQNFI